MTLVRDFHVLLVDWADDAIRQVERWADTEVGGDAAEVARRLASLPEPGRARGMV